MEMRLRLKQAVRESPTILEGSFSYPFTRLLVDQLKKLVEEKKVVNEEDQHISELAYAVAKNIELQTRWPDNMDSINGMSDTKKVENLIMHADAFLAIFEE